MKILAYKSIWTTSSEKYKELHVKKKRIMYMSLWHLSIGYCLVQLNMEMSTFSYLTEIQVENEPKVQEIRFLPKC